MKIKDKETKEKTIDAEIVFVAILGLAFIVAFVNRLFYGIETSDEAYYDVTGYRLLQGNIPYGDMWEPNALDAYVMVPFLMVHKLIHGNIEGLHVFLRLSFMILQLVGLWSVYLYAKKEINGKYAFLLGLAFWLYAPFNLYNFSYNSMSILFITASLCMMHVRKKEERKAYEYLTGIFMGLAVLVYPTVIYCCFIVAIIIAIVIRGKQALNYLVFYAAGGLTIAIPVLIHMTTTCGLQRVIHNLSIIMSSGVTPTISINRLIKCVHDGIVYFKTPFSMFGMFFTLYFLSIAILGIIQKTRRIGKCLAILYPVICYYYCVVRDAGYLFPFAVCIIAPLVILLSDNRMEMFKKVIIEWGTSMLIYFVIIYSSAGGVENANRSTIFATIVAIKLMMEVVQDDPLLKFKKIKSYVSLTCLIFGLISFFYRGIYRDNPYDELTAKVESGVYKGIYTTLERKRHINDLETILSQVEDEGETVMILYHSCYAYLMMDMVPKIPSSWGCINYEGYGYDNQELFMNYLSQEENIPENIIIIDIPKQFDYAGQQVESYEPYYPILNQFIRDHYTYQGVFEEGLSGRVMKYEIDKESF